MKAVASQLDSSFMLSVENLHTRLLLPAGEIQPVNDVSFGIRPGTILGLVGESGSGKSMTALSLMRLLPRSVRHMTKGRALLNGVDLLSLSDRRMRSLRGEKVSMVFQNPGRSLNPVFSIGNQLFETLSRCGMAGRGMIKKRSVELLTQVGLPDPEQLLGAYSWELSGGMQQRVMIALAMAGEPELLIADEPTTALDVTVQKRVLRLMAGLVREKGAAMLLITHDLGVVAEVCDEVAVMYTGRIVESASARELFSDPQHPYTKGLLESVKRLDQPEDGSPLAAIPGQAPDMADLPEGCTFSPRCTHVMDICKTECPSLTQDGGREVRCFLQRK